MELIVVITIMVLLIGIAVPGFTAIIRSSETSLAVNKLATGLGAGRDAAVTAGVGSDGAAVFFFEPGGRTVIVPCVQVGVLADRTGGTGTVDRDVFVPLPGIEPVQLPANWTVRGFAPRNSIDSPVNPNGWYDAGTYDPDEGNWVFPETGFYDQTAADDGADRQTFMVRFDGGTGAVSTSKTEPALVVAERPSDKDRPPSGLADWTRIDHRTDLGRWARRVLVDASLSDDDRRDLLGDRSGDTVLVRPVTELALANEIVMARDLGIRLDALTGSIYRDKDDPEFVPGADASAINDWIRDFESPARVYSVERFTGGLQEMVKDDGS